MARTDRTDRAAWFGVQRSQVGDWGARRTLRLKRMGIFLEHQRRRIGDSLTDVAAAGRAQDEAVAKSTIARLEALRNLLEDEDAPRDLSFMAIWFLTRYYGLSLGDLEQYMLTGDVSALQPGEQARLDALRTMYLQLDPANREDLEQFAQFLYGQQQTMLAQQSRVNATETTRHDTPAPEEASARR